MWCPVFSKYIPEGCNSCAFYEQLVDKCKVLIKIENEIANGKIVITTKVD